MVLRMGLRGTTSLYIFGSPYSLDGLEPCGRSCSATSCGSEAFFMRAVVFLSVVYVGSLASFLYAGSSRTEAIFWLIVYRSKDDGGVPFVSR